MQRQLATEFYQAIGQTGRNLDETDLATAQELIERLGSFEEARRKILAVAEFLVEMSASVPSLTAAASLVWRVLAEPEAALQAREQKECERREQQRQEQRKRKEDDKRALAERQQYEGALEALPPRRRNQLLAEVRSAYPHEAESFIRQLAGRVAYRNAEEVIPERK